MKMREPSKALGSDKITDESTSLAEMPETPLLGLVPSASALTGLIRGSVFVKSARANGAKQD